jgi:hypothetical protein
MGGSHDDVSEVANVLFKTALPTSLLHSFSFNFIGTQSFRKKLNQFEPVTTHKGFSPY